MRTKPSMEEPSNINWLLTAFSIWEAVMIAVLELAENVGKLQAHELDFLFPDDSDDVLLCCRPHGLPPLSL